MYPLIIQDEDVYPYNKDGDVYPCNSRMKMCTLIIKEEDVYPSN